MRKLLLTLLLVPYSLLAQSIPVTPNLGLQLIPDGYQNWGVPYRTTMTTIDTWSATVARFPGANGIVFSTGLTTSRVATSTDVIGLWTSCSSGYLMFNGTCSTPAGGVSSVFGRTGSVVAATNDYTFSQIGGTIASGQLPATIAADTTGNATTATQLLLTPTQCSGGTPVATGIQANGNANCTAGGGGGAVSSVFGRTGAVVAATNDYSFSQISGVAAPAQLPVATTSAFGAVKPDGTTVTISAGVISAAGGGGNTTSTSLTTNTVPKANGANSIINSAATDDGTTWTYNGSGGAAASSIGVGQVVFTGSTPTIANGVGAGTSPGTPTIAGSNMAGVLTVITGSSPPSGAIIATITYSVTLSVAPQSCQVFPRNLSAAGQSGIIFTPAPTATSWTINVGGSSGSLPASTTLIWSYICE